MAIQLEKLFEAVKVYGAPLYGAEATIDYGTIDFAGQYPVENDCLVIEDASGICYVPIRRSVREAEGFDPDTHMFSIGGFKALRDATGEYNGKTWEVKAGEMKTFAF